MISFQSDRRSNARAFGQITSNFLTQRCWRLYRINLPVCNLQLPYKYDGNHGGDGHHGKDGHHGQAGHLDGDGNNGLDGQYG